MSLNSPLKDQRLAYLADNNENVAQFASFEPGSEPTLRYQRIRGLGNHAARLEKVAAALLAVSSSCNVRTFRTPPVKSSPFEYGLTRLDDILGFIRKYAAEGYYTIINETIDVDDGGVSGVALGGIVEFAPQATPRAVEEADAFTAPYELGFALLDIVYGFRPKIPQHLDRRIEFSIHPRKVGYHRSHTLLWEEESIAPVHMSAQPIWPNRFSRFLGDKAFGLVVAHILGFPVPRTMVIPRRIAPFVFGQGTSSNERWMRTCPTEQVPGKFTTTEHWSDPFLVMAEEDPTGQQIASVLSQDGIEAAYSGATAPRKDGSDEVEGVPGPGLLFMQGRRQKGVLPRQVKDDVHDLLAKLNKALGACRIEWVHDGNKPWVVQLHVVRERLTPGVLSPGEADHWLNYDPAEGLERLRRIVNEARYAHAGVLVANKVGITSHVGDILRRAQVPARFAE